MSEITPNKQLGAPDKPPRTIGQESNTSLDRRVAMGTRAHEGNRASRGRTTSSRTPVHVHDTTPGGAVDRDWLHQCLGFKLGKFATRMDRMDVTVRDESGPNGAPTISATIRLQVPRRKPIAVSARGTTARAAISAAIRSCERTLRRKVERGETTRQPRRTADRLRPADE